MIEEGVEESLNVDVNVWNFVYIIYILGIIGCLKGVMIEYCQVYYLVEFL